MFVSEFKKFIIQGSIIDVAVGIIMGASFTTIVRSFVGDIVMPVAGLFTSGMNFSQQFITLDGKHYRTISEAKEAMAPIITYGVFVNAMINFLIVAMVVFFLVRFVNKMRTSMEEEKAKLAGEARQDDSLVKDRLMLEEVKKILLR